MENQSETKYLANSAMTLRMGIVWNMLNMKKPNRP